MLNKSLFATAIATLVASNVANASPAPYVGASLGITTNTSSNVANAGAVINPAGNYRGIPFSVFAGYGGVLDQNFYLAGEAFGTIGTAEITNNYGLKTTYGYGASIVPGVLLSDHTVAFGRAGVVRTRFTDANTTRTGGQVGFGLQTNLTQNVDFRTEYDYTSYGTFNNNVGRVASPHADTFTVGLIYKFD